FIEQRLPATATVVIPPNAADPKHVVTNLEFLSVFGRVLDDFLAPPSTFAGKAGGLIDEACRYRPALVDEWSSIAAELILKYALPTAETDLDNAVSVAVAANPPAAGAVVRGAIRRIAAKAVGGPSPQQVRLDREIAARYSGNVARAAV